MKSLYVTEKTTAKAYHTPFHASECSDSKMKHTAASCLLYIRTREKMADACFSAMKFGKSIMVPYNFDFKFCD